MIPPSISREMDVDWIFIMSPAAIFGYSQRFGGLHIEFDLRRHIHLNSYMH